MPGLKEFYELLQKQHELDHEWWPTVSSNPRFEIMVGCILTQNTNWENAFAAIENLYHAGLLEEGEMLRVSEEKLRQLIRPSGYYNQKAARLKRLAGSLGENSVASLMKMQTSEAREKLLSIKGVGEETADSMLLYALDKPVFVIDAYTRRIVSRWGLASRKASYSELKKMFEKELTKKVNLFKTYHALLVEHGKAICKSKPLCEACELFGICEKNF